MATAIDTRFTMTIDGLAAEADAVFPVVNPATGAPFAHAPDCGEDQLDAAARAAGESFDGWAADLPARRTALAAAAALLKERVDELALLLTLEQGKPLADARIEVLGCARWLRYHARLDLEPEILQDDRYGRAQLVHRPVGPTAAITAWNFPLTLMCWKLGPALLAGCTVVVKPSPYTPLTTLRFGELLRDVLPPGVVNVVSGRDPLGARLIAHPGIRKVSFTGSIATGKHIAGAVADDLKRVTLELGGNDAAIVLDDADPGEIAERLFWSAFANCGQICAAAKRLYVPDVLHDAVVEALAAIARTVTIGDGLDDGVVLGPVNNARQCERVAGLVDDARRRGGRVVTGGPLDRPGWFYRPAIVTDLRDGVALVDEEQFGPALPVIRYARVEDAIAAANGTRYGLGGSVWGTDLDRARSVAARLSCGTTWINAHTVLAPHQPFGGLRWSGLGVENGPWGVAAFTELQVLWEPARAGVD